MKTRRAVSPHPPRSCLSFAACVLFVASMLLSVAPLRAADAPAPLELTAEEMKDGAAEVDERSWSYRMGDDPAWAAKDYDDSAWATEGWDDVVAERAASPAGERWGGAAWFRLRLRVADELANQPLALRMEHWGASELYIDGRLVKRFGVIGADKDVEQNPRWQPVSFVFTEGGAHVIALRYSFKASRDSSSGVGRWLARGNFRPGFEAGIYTADFAAARHARNSSNARGVLLYVGILAALALLHFLLYVFYRRERANLFYSLFAAGLGAAQVLSPLYQSGGIGGADSAFGAGLGFVAWYIAFTIAMPSLLAFHYVAFEGGFPRRFRLILLLWGAAAISVIVYVRQYITLYLVCVAFAFTLIEAIRVMVRAVTRRQPGAWIIITGLTLFTVSVCLQLGREILDMDSSTGLVNELEGYAILLAVPLSVSIYLARNFARTNLDLAAQLTQVQELSAREIEHERTEADLRFKHEQERAENERRSQELEEARLLQLSMLPKSVPQLARFDIAAYMKPASEVGGDYYDFRVGADDTLTVVVGDATGHGLKAGTIVTATKSLFNAFAAEPDVTAFFRRSSLALKGMNLRGLYMALVMLKIRGASVTLGAAGMPPILVYRAGTGEVEEILVKGMPLGSIKGYAYKEQHFDLSAGDAVVLMSDGFPERFDERGEMLGYDRARAVLAEVAHKTATEIVERFVSEGDEWASAKAQDDDVTFVVLKVRGLANVRSPTAR